MIKIACEEKYLHSPEAPGGKVIKETIEMAAIKDKVTGSVFALPKPKRHHDVIALMSSHKISPHGCTQGFMTSRDRFVDRYEAARLANAAGQIIGRTGAGGIPYKIQEVTKLFSEDLW